MVTMLIVGGCIAPKHKKRFGHDLEHFHTSALRVAYPDVEDCEEELRGESSPHTLRDVPDEYWDLSLEEVLEIALSRCKVLRDLGGTVIRSPSVVSTVHDPAIQESDPQAGVEAALSAFDADWTTSLFYEVNDRRVNNTFLGNLGFIQQDFGLFETRITKPTATGSQFSISKTVEYDRNNAIGNQFPDGAWNVFLDAEARQPLLQGSGLRFNRIAGPGGAPGIYNGVLIARIRTDVSLADFELGVREFVSNVENTYWDLYFAYRDLEARIYARNAALDTWRRVHALFQAGRRGGEADKEAQAREQFFRFQEDVQNALSGRLVERTRTNNGSGGGTFRPVGGVLVTERQLRLLMNLPLRDGRLIRPDDEPTVAKLVYEWDEFLSEAHARRAELRRQRWQVKRRELEYIAAKNFLLPNLDFVGRYRWRGFGDRLIDPTGNQPRFDNAHEDLTSGDFQEWQVGMELAVPIGYRQAHSGVRNAQLRLARSRTVLREQQRQVSYGLSNVVADMERAYIVVQTSYNRQFAAREQLDALQARVDAEASSGEQADSNLLDLLLDAQRRYADSQSRYYQTQVEYVLAIKNVHFEKGSLLDYCGVSLTEGGWVGKAYQDAARRAGHRGRPRKINYAMSDRPITAGCRCRKQRCNCHSTEIRTETEDAVPVDAEYDKPAAVSLDPPRPLPPTE